MRPIVPAPITAIRIPGPLCDYRNDRGGGLLYHACYVGRSAHNRTTETQRPRRTFFFSVSSVSPWLYSDVEVGQAASARCPTRGAPRKRSTISSKARAC